MIIRKAIIEDIGQLSVLFDKYRIFYEQPGDIEGAKTFLSERIMQNESVIFVALLNQQMVGFTQLFPIFSSVGMKRTWLLNDLYVTEDARGSGAADALLTTAQQMGVDTKSRWMLLQTAVTNKRAQKVYARNGWKRDEEYYAYYYRIEG
jgi:GNAT superfamily N-acetyltransferase